MDEKILEQLAQLQAQQAEQGNATLEQLLAMQRMMGTPKEKLVAEGPYSYEFQPEQAEKIEELSKAIDILQNRIEESPKQTAVAALGMLGLLSTLAAVAYGKKI